MNVENFIKLTNKDKRECINSLVRQLSLNEDRNNPFAITYSKKFNEFFDINFEFKEEFENKSKNKTGIDFLERNGLLDDFYAFLTDDIAFVYSKHNKRLERIREEADKAMEEELKNMPPLIEPYPTFEDLIKRGTRIN